MKYQVLFTELAKKQLKKMDKYTAALIIGWLEKNVVGCSNPRLHGKPLVADKIRAMEIQSWRLQNNLWDWW